MSINAGTDSSPLVALIANQLSGLKYPVTWSAKTSLAVGNNTINGAIPVARFLSRSGKNIHGSTPLLATQVDHWIDFASKVAKTKGIDALLRTLDAHLSSRTYTVGYALSLADAALFTALHAHGEWEQLRSNVRHVLRWFTMCFEFFEAAVVECDAHFKPAKEVAKAKGEKSKGDDKPDKTADVAKMMVLENAVHGQVVTRFPPEASGYLHIGHAKAAMLNQYYAKTYNGKMLLRFDDTNPEKENAEFEKAILEDLKLLQIDYASLTRTSDYFEVMLGYCEKMIKAGKAYADDTPQEKMGDDRMNKRPSPNRDNSVEKNLAMWEEMKKGSEVGLKNVIRAKIQYDSENGAMRDPTLYRCKTEPHLTTGTRFKAYPTYDFACPIVDSLEGVTHALRTTEYGDRNAQYKWLCEAMSIRCPIVNDYSRLNLVYTIMSKRQLTWFVQNKKVDGWSDPRFPTVRGILRHGMTVEGLRNFILSVGASRNVALMEWDKIWAMNKQVIDPVAPRHTAILKTNAVPVTVVGASAAVKQVAAHPKNPDVGLKEVAYSDKIWIEDEDASSFAEGETVTLMDWGNALVAKIEKSGPLVKSVTLKLTLENTDYNKTKKITWVADTSDSHPQIPITANYYFSLITKPFIPKGENLEDFLSDESVKSINFIGASSLATLKQGDIIQVTRKGFFICDKEYNKLLERPLTLIYIPDGHQKIVGMGSAASSSVSADDIKKLEGEIASQTQVVKQLKTSKADKEDIKKAEGLLKDLRTQLEKYNSASKSSSTPASTPVSAPSSSSSPAGNADKEKLQAEVKALGDQIRAKKEKKEDVAADVAKLKQLKENYQKVTGEAYPEPGKKPSEKKEEKPAASSSSSSSTSSSSVDKEKLQAEVKALGDQIRAKKEKKEDVAADVAKLKQLKENYQKVTGEAYPEPGKKPSEKKEEKPKEEKKKEEKKKEVKPKKADEDHSLKKETKLGMEFKKEEDLSNWYKDVLTKAELIEYYDVSGCYVLRPWSYAIWERIQAFFDTEIKKLGVENAYFPLFVSKAALEKEKEHIADFAPEVAWVTKSGSSDLAEPIAIRPTSETIMYPSFARWVQSHRDLPIKINQWSNVVRWEFKQPTPFLRTREFLWQEGHTAYAEKAPAEKEVLDILELYARVYEELLAVPVVRGRKTLKEKFAGGDYTTTVEAFIPANGRGIQGATSHHLGQNFSKMFEIDFVDQNSETKFAYQNSWGLTTRTIGVVIMVHSDNKGLMLPPRVAAVQVIIIPTGTSKVEDRDAVLGKCHALEKVLQDAGVRVRGDYGDNYSPPWKYNHYELKGVPIRVEVGPRDVKNAAVTVFRRDTFEKITIPESAFVKEITALLEQIQSSMYGRALKERDNQLKTIDKWEDFCPALDAKNIILAPFCEAPDCEGRIKEDSATKSDDPTTPNMGAKSLCIPFKQAHLPANTKCIHPACSVIATRRTLFGRSY